MSTTPMGGGERQGGREAIEKVARRWTEGGMDPQKAKQKAIEVAVKHDKRNPR